MPKSEFTKISALSLLAMALIFAFSFLFFTSGFEPLRADEQKLGKNSGFTMRPGDFLAYELKYGNFSEQTVFLFGRRVADASNLSQVIYANCTLVWISGSNISTCINGDGTDIGGSNQTLFSTEFFFFSPWMLALAENFSWKARMLNSITGWQVESFSARLLRKEDFRGRNAYVLEVNETGPLANITKTVWVDTERRIILKEENENYAVEIIRAPFPLGQRAE